jgi:hypothetical protein
MKFPEESNEHHKKPQSEMSVSQSRFEPGIFLNKSRKLTCSIQSWSRRGAPNGYLTTVCLSYPELCTITIRTPC